MSTTSQAQDRRSTHRAMLPVVMLALATVVSAVASLNVALPSIARDTHATQTQLSWVIDAYALVFAALLLLGGAIGDRYGRRRALVAGLVIFGGGSLAAMAVSDPAWLIALRGVLGLGAALVMPATLSTITSTFPDEQRARAVGAWAGVAGASAILGLLASGLLLQAWSWRAVFGLNVVLAVLAILGALRFIPDSADPDAPRLDLLGAVLTVAGLGVLVYSIIQAPTQGWGSARTLGGIALGVVVLAGFIGWELTRTHPLLDPRLFAHRAFTAGTVSIGLQFFRVLRLRVPGAAVPAAGPRKHTAGGGGEPDPDGAGDDARRTPDRAPHERAHRATPRVRTRAGVDHHRPARLVSAGHHERVLAAAERASSPRRRHGPGHDTGDHRHHRRPARGPARGGLGDERPRPRTRRRPRDRRPRQRAAIDLPPPAAPGRAARADRRARPIVPGHGVPARSTITHQAQAAFTGGMQSALLYAAIAVGIAAVAVVGLLHDHADPSTSAPDPEAVSRRSMTPSTD